MNIKNIFNTSVMGAVGGTFVGVGTGVYVIAKKTKIDFQYAERVEKTRIVAHNIFSGSGVMVLFGTTAGLSGALFPRLAMLGVLSAGAAVGLLRNIR